MALPLVPKLSVREPLVDGVGGGVLGRPEQLPLILVGLHITHALIER